MKTLKFLLLTILLGFLLGGCSKKPKCSKICLPNGYEVCGKKFASKAHPGSTNIVTSEDCLGEKSYTQGSVTYIGLLNLEDNSLSINNIHMEAKGGSGGLIISNRQNAMNNVTLFDNAGIIIKIKVHEEKEYLMQLKTKNELIPAISLEYFAEGHQVRFPTVREYESCHGQGHNNHTYRILNEVDYLYINEIKKVP